MKIEVSGVAIIYVNYEEIRSLSIATNYISWILRKETLRLKVLRMALLCIFKKKWNFAIAPCECKKEQWAWKYDNM